MKLTHRNPRHLTSVLFCLCVLFANFAVGSFAQKNEPNGWQDLLSKNRRLVRWEALWQVRISQPATPTDVDARVAEVRESYAESDMNKEAVDKLVEFTKKIIESDNSGYNQVNQLQIISDKQKALANVTYGMRSKEGINLIPEENLTPPVLEYSDGNYEIRTKGWTQESGKKIPFFKLSRVSKDSLSESAPGLFGALFLRSSPLELWIDIEEALVISNNDEEIVLQVREGDFLNTVTLSKRYGRATQMEVKGFYNKRIYDTYSASNFKEFGEGIWLPQQITANNGIRFGIPKVTNYILSRAQINDQVDSNSLELPLGSRIQDQRFGDKPENVLTYIYNGRIPTEEEVRRSVEISAASLPRVEDLPSVKVGVANPSYKIGHKAPDFSVLDSEGKMWSLNELRGKQVLLTFFPKCFTGGCANHLSSLRDHQKEFDDANTQILAVSVDPAQGDKGQLAFAKQWGFSFPLIPDSSRQLGKQFGAIQNDDELAARMSVLIDKSGVVRWIDTDVQVKTHGADVLAKVAELGLNKP